VNNILIRIAWATALIGAVAGMIVGFWYLIRRVPRLAGWIVLALIAGALIWLIEMRLPSRYEVDPDLPVFRHLSWTWALGFALVSLAALAGLVRSLWSGPARESEDVGAEPRFPDLDAAWESIRLRLGQAGIALPDQRVFLVLAPDESVAEAVVRAAGLTLFAQAPEVPAPIHAYSTAESLLLSCSGASNLGRQDAEATPRLESLCRTLLRLDPERPVVRGVVVLLPAEWAAKAEASGWAAAVREDLRVVRTILKVRLPVFALIPQAETLAGLEEFIARIPDAMRLSRCGFALPSTVTFSGDLMQRGLSWLAGWFDTWGLNLMSGDLADGAGNGRLYSLSCEIRARRKRWRDILEAAFSTHRESEPVLLRGCYLSATGDRPQLQAFAAGLLRGARSRILADHVLADWSEDARRDDRVYRRAALAVALVGGLLTLLAWSWIVRQHPLWWIGFVAVIVAWMIALAVLIRRAY
jgi:type VI secretion system protein ImpL